MIYNYTSFNGRCVSMVQYPNYKTENLADRAPMVIRYGYGACEYNLGSLSTPRVGVGTSASDKGWPTELVKNGSAGSSAASWDSPNSRILTVFGGLETNYMRNYGESWRVFTSMYLHGGFLHIGINLLCQIQSLWMLEPVREQRVASRRASHLLGAAASCLYCLQPSTSWRILRPKGSSVHLLL